jgi:alcohol dehydrogenase class IV
MIINQILMPEKTIYRNGAIESLGSITAQYGKRVLLISDPTMEKIGLVEKCERLLDHASLTYATYTAVYAESTDEYVREALAILQHEKCDVIVAVGGGSCIDTAKAVGIVATNGGQFADYVIGQRSYAAKSIPVIAAPTTAGSGSEVSQVTVIIDTVTHIKMMKSDPLLMPVVALVDPLLTLSCPPQVTAATGVDALCHAIESYLSVKAHPITELYSLRAAELIAQNLRKVYHDGQNIEARANLALGSMLAGMAFSNSSVTLVHGMSRPIGALFHVPHGISNAMLLPVVLEFVQYACPTKMKEIGRRINGRVSSGSAMDGNAIDGADSVVLAIKRLCRDLGITNLKSYGIDYSKFRANMVKMASDAIDSGSPANTPRLPTHAEIVELYHKAYDYDFSAQ